MMIGQIRETVAAHRIEEAAGHVLESSKVSGLTAKSTPKQRMAVIDEVKRP
jgi:hypothetical protein